MNNKELRIKELDILIPDKLQCVIKLTINLNDIDLHNKKELDRYQHALNLLNENYSLLMKYIHEREDLMKEIEDSEINHRH